MQVRIEIQKHAKFEIEEITKAHAEEMVRFETKMKSYADAKDRIEEQLKAEIAYTATQIETCYKNNLFMLLPDYVDKLRQLSAVD